MTFPISRRVVLIFSHFVLLYVFLQGGVPPTRYSAYLNYEGKVSDTKTSKARVTTTFAHMGKRPMPNLRTRLIRLASEHPEFRKDILPLLQKGGGAEMPKQAINLPNVGEDNSWGRGYYPLPPKLRHLATFADIFRYVIDHKVWPDEGMHMITVPSSVKFSVMVEDLKYLVKLGLLRIQVNEVGQISFYFSEV